MSLRKDNTEIVCVVRVPKANSVCSKYLLTALFATPRISCERQKQETEKQQDSPCTHGLQVAGA